MSLSGSSYSYFTNLFSLFWSVNFISHLLLSIIRVNLLYFLLKFGLKNPLSCLCVEYGGRGERQLA